MMKIEEIIHQAEQLPTAEKWQLVKQLLQSLENEQTIDSELTDWHQFLRETYGSLRDTPIQRWEQGEYEERESLE